MTLTLDNGTEYMLPKAFKDPGLKAGEKVTAASASSRARRNLSPHFGVILFAANEEQEGTLP